MGTSVVVVVFTLGPGTDQTEMPMRTKGQRRLKVKGGPTTQRLYSDRGEIRSRNQAGGISWGRGSSGDRCLNVVNSER